MTPRRTITTAVSTAALAAATAFIAVPAQASGGTHSVEEVDFTAPMHLSDACGFPVRLHVQGSFNVVSFTDENGNPTKEIRNYRFRGTLTANGVTIQGLSMGPEIWTYNEDGTATVEVHGVVNRRIPGQGTVTLFAGYSMTYIDGDVEVELVEPTGQAESAAPLCSVLAG